MLSLSYPGVYLQEVTSGVRPIQAASTSTAAFVGVTEMGPDDRATLVTSWMEFQRTYGTFLTPSSLAHHVYQFFNNGGRQCYILRVTHPEDTAAAALVPNRSQPAQNGWAFSAKSRGKWGNALALQIGNGSRDPGNEFSIHVRLLPGVIQPNDILNVPPTETFDNLSIQPNSPNYVIDVLNRSSNLVRVSIDPANIDQQQGVHYGGWGAINPNDGQPLSFKINLDGKGFGTVNLPADQLKDKPVDQLAPLIQAAVLALAKDDPAYSGFSCTAESQTVGAKDQQWRLVLRSGTRDDASSVRVLPDGQSKGASVLKLGPYGDCSEDGYAVRRPAIDDFYQLGGGTDITGSISAPAFNDALSKLDNFKDFSLLAIPGIGTPDIMDVGMAYCARRPLNDVFYIGEMTDQQRTYEDAVAFRGQLNNPNSYGAIYFPWLKVADPTGSSKDPILMSPSGYIAGLYSRIDASRGVWKAPAGTEAALFGVVGLDVELPDEENGRLNDLGVNVIRRFPTYGVVAFGARTVSPDPEWRYIPVRRTAIMLRRAIYDGIQWAVFEPNDEPLWAQLRLNIGSFLITLFRQGALQGSTPAQAFFVKCDGETTTKEDIGNGIVNIWVGFAPLRPAEFVVVRLSQMAGQAST